MKYIQHRSYVEIPFEDDFDLEKIFECGQCFRWRREKDGSYIGVALGRAAWIQKAGGRILLSGSGEDLETVWGDYFDMKVLYAEIRQSLCIDEYMRKATEFGAGIRILRQDRWEALCSFVLSQCNNIPRIRMIIEKLCALYGDRVYLGDREMYTFPSAERVAALSPEDLLPVRCGYRAPYVLEAARAVASGELDLEALASADFAETLAALRSLGGVGDKVAQCAMLFSLHRLDAFPVDVWMRRAIREHYGDSFDPSVFGSYAGLAQQYMFYYQRSKDCCIEKKEKIKLDMGKESVIE